MPTAARKPAAKTTAQKPAPKTTGQKPGTLSPLDELQQAIGDLDKVRQSVKGEAQTQLDNANARLHALASDLHELAEEQVQQLESSLEHAGESLRVELAVRAIRAQRSTEALTRLSGEIRKRRAALTE